MLNLDSKNMTAGNGLTKIFYKKGQILLLALALFIPSAQSQATASEQKISANCGGAVSCRCGDTVTSSYTMTGNLSCPTFGLLIDSPADDIILDCAGHTINAFFIWGYEGINIRNRTSHSVTIKNCRLQNFDYSIKLNDASNVTIADNVFKTPRIYALRSLNGSNNNFLDNIIESQEIGLSLEAGGYNNINGNSIKTFNDKGLEIKNSNFNIIVNNLLDSNSTNIYLANSHNNLLSFNTSTNGYVFGLYLTNSRFNTIWANHFELNQTNAYQAASSTDNQWYSDTRGNYWDDLQDNPWCPLAYQIGGVETGYDFHPTGPNCADNDGDGYGLVCAYNCPSLGLDCNDNNSAIHPGQAEICGNNIDENCNGNGDDRCRRGGKQQYSSL